MASTARVQKILEEAADLTQAERVRLAEELVRTVSVTNEDMERQRQAIKRFMAVPPVLSGSPG